MEPTAAVIAPKALPMALAALTCAWVRGIRTATIATLTRTATADAHHRLPRTRPLPPESPISVGEFGFDAQSGDLSLCFKSQFNSPFASMKALFVNKYIAHVCSIASLELRAHPCSHKMNLGLRCISPRSQALRGCPVGLVGQGRGRSCAVRSYIASMARHTLLNQPPERVY